MKNTHPEYQYLDLLTDILKNGEEQVDRGTRVKTYSVFGRQIRFDLSESFPLLTTKKVYWKGQRVARMENSFPQRALLLDDVQVDDDDALSALRNNLQARFDMSIEIQALSHFIHRPTI